MKVNRTRHSAAFKAQVAIEALKEQETIRVFINGFILEIYVLNGRKVETSIL